MSDTSGDQTPGTPEIIQSSVPAAATRAPSASAKKENEKEKESKPKTFTSVKDLGLCYDRNARYRRSMEDEHVYVDAFGGEPTTGYFAVYDGHGGKDAVQFVRDNLHLNFEEELKTNEDVHDAYKKSYVKTDDMIGEAEIKYSGTTTVSALLRTEGEQRKLYIANVGDARAVLARNGKGLRLTYDHKASDPAETKRIQEAGGFVVMNRVNGILAVSRSLGDRAMKEYVSGEPYTTETVIEEGDTHLILACDGVWDVISDDQAVELVQQFDTCQEAAKKLLIAALRKGSTDNISVMVMKL